MKLLMILLVLLAASPAAAEDALMLREYLRQTYPSLAYVQRYRAQFPQDIQGDEALWAAGTAVPTPFRSPADVVQALVGLQDHHVSLTGDGAGGTETLGVLFRTSSDGNMVVWRVFDPAVDSVQEGDVVVAVNNTPTAEWLQHMAADAFGGNRRSRMAKAAMELGMGSRLVHQSGGLDKRISLRLQRPDKAFDAVLSYVPMTADHAAAIAAAINRADLPRFWQAHGFRIGTLRLGAFAPQFDPLFMATAERAEKQTGMSEEQAMVAGFCAVVQRFIAEANEVARRSDLIVLDLRGNFGGFGREARLFASALTPAALPASVDVFASGRHGVLRLQRQPEDPSCGRIAKPRPLVVLVDAGTRSSGELMAAWLWASGAMLGGERTIGAGGGLDSESTGFALPESGLRVRSSGNFTFFDASRSLTDGETDEAALIDLVAQDGFAKSRSRPFAIQAVGLRPDTEMPIALSDLRDHGVTYVGRLLAQLKAQGRLR